ncbi:MAG: Signal transduction histidine kinase [Rhodospirillales bacterium]|nr:Signal transduction histidine kinase [Rhodospirillales bacterium]
MTGPADPAELQHLRAQLLEAQMRVRQADETHARILATVAHEIRGPLHAMLSLLRLLRESGLDTQRGGWVETARQSGHGLIGLLDDLLEFGSAESGSLALMVAPFQPTSLFGGIVDLVRPRAAAKCLRFESEFALGEASWLSGDARRLRQIVFNLVGNAVKFTERGVVRLRATATPTPDGQFALVIEVSDTGPGFDPALTSSLFGDFVQGPEARRSGGAGLGLAIVRRLVELMGGTIEAESEPGKGARFRVRLTLPRAEALSLPVRAPMQAPAAPAVLTPAAPPSRRRLQVLLVEDSSTNRAVALAMLKTAPLTVDAVENGMQAIERLKQTPYDLVLMDVLMPVMDGLEATRAIRALEDPISRVPVIAMTANAMAADEVRCREAGMDDYLTKPIERANLLAMLARWLGPLEEPRPAIDETVVVRLLQEVEPGALTRLLGVFLDEAGHRAARIEAAVAQLDSPEAIARIEYESHAMKGSAETFGAAALAARAASIETAIRVRALDSVRAKVSGLAAMVVDAEGAYRARGYVD